MQFFRRGAPALLIVCATLGGVAHATTTAQWTPTVSWNDTTGAAQDLSATRVSCAGRSFCLALDAKGYGSRFNGTSWSAPAKIGPTDGAALSCASAHFCMLADADSYSTYDGSRWSAARPFVHGSLLYVTRVTCTSAAFCAATGSRPGASLLMTYTRGTWHLTAEPSRETYSGLSCATAGYCVAVGSGLSHTYVADARTFNGHSWSAPVLFDRKAALFTGLPDSSPAVSCPRVGFCLAMDNEGSATTFNGRSWSSPVLTGLRPGDAVLSVSVTCASSHFCLATMGNGDEEGDENAYSVAFNGHAFSAVSIASDVVDSTAFNYSVPSVSCPSAFYCVLGGDSRVVVSTGQNDGPFTPGRPAPTPGR